MRVGRLTAFVVLASALTVTPALADVTFVVTTTLDIVDPDLHDGQCGFALPPHADGTPRPRFCTLRAAIQEANNTTEHVVIHLPAGRYSLTIRGSDEDFDSATGDLDVWGDVVIIGDGAGVAELACPPAAPVERLRFSAEPGCFATLEESSTTIVGSNADRLFDVHGGTAHLRLSGVGLIGGRVRGGRFATEGGAIRNDGTLSLSNVAVYGNFADNGGALSNTGAADLEFTTMRNNSAGSGCGGAIMNRGLMRINLSVFESNRAGGDGGGICNHSTYTSDFPIAWFDDEFLYSMQIVNAAIDSNISRRGGGIASNSSLSLAFVALRSNVAGDGGGMLAERGDGDPKTRFAFMFDVVVTTNVATRNGGGLWLGGDYTGVRAGRIESNGAFANGGGVFVSGTANVKMTQTSISENQTLPSGSGGGVGAVLTASGLIEILNTTLSGNEAGTGGGLDVTGAAGSRLRLRSVTLANNVARRSSPHVHTGGVSLLLKNTLSTRGLFSPGLVDVGRDCEIGGPITEAGRNLADDLSCVPSPAEVMPAPFVNPLDWNGGFTRTHALRGDSPAIDGVTLEDCDRDIVDEPGVFFDQRFVTRPRLAACDIGAYEATLEISGPIAVRAPALIETASAAGQLVFTGVGLQQWLLSLSQQGQTPADGIVDLSLQLTKDVDAAWQATDDQMFNETLLQVSASLSALDKATAALGTCCGAFQKDYRFHMLDFALERFRTAFGQLQVPPKPVEK